MCHRESEEFLPFGTRNRRNARCPKCGSLERHRVFWLYLQSETGFLLGTHPTRLLHIAPEKPIERSLRKAPKLDYLSGDIEPGRAMERH